MNTLAHIASNDPPDPIWRTVFWILLILCGIGYFAPAPWPRVSFVVLLILIALLGFRAYPISAP